MPTFPEDSKIAFHLSKSEQNLFTKAKGCINQITKASKECDEVLKERNERCAATTDEIFRQGLNRLINKIESEMTMLGKRVNQERRYGEMLFTTFYKDLKYLN